MVSAARDIIDNMFDYLPEDGYANNVNYIRLSSNFPYFPPEYFTGSQNL